MYNAGKHVHANFACRRDGFLLYREIKTHDKDVAISINTVNCRRETRAYRAPLDLAGATNRRAFSRLGVYRERDDGSFGKWAPGNNVGFYRPNKNVVCPGDVNVAWRNENGNIIFRKMIAPLSGLDRTYVREPTVVEISRKYERWRKEKLSPRFS